jgi:hypothetical protein
MIFSGPKISEGISWPAGLQSLQHEKAVHLLELAERDVDWSY